MKLIAVTSGKGGTGKSSIAAYTGVALSVQQQKTLLLEQGKDPRSLDVIAAAQHEAVFDLADVLEGRCEPEKAIVAAAYTTHLDILPAPAGQYLLPQPQKLLALLQTLSPQYEYIFIDGVDFTVLPPRLFDLILMVTTPDTLSARACRELTRELYAQGAESVRLVINNVPPQIIPIHGVQDFDDLIDMVGAQLIAVVPQSPKLHYSANNSKMLDEETVTIQVFDNLAARLRGQSKPLLIR